ncbi:LuxR C-terminal-related transcriptional regulator [Nocardioides sp. YIM 152315]|uniref:LuxR C-terminal-related transcriptional regulator n=1 Tax=Nocardioides sp. YIM 152315 TaxID=3031760 RepID=UPI0023D9F28A|nr:LuxR C-terminal-related transcriptional regulator [Nocardioides sp. YIM 152315]
MAGHVVRFRHPLVRAAATSRASAAARRAAHTQLAAAYDDDPERQARHRAEATVVPDEDVAGALALASELALRRGASAEATRLMVRASELSVDRVSREERVLHAVQIGSVSGSFEWAAETGTRLRLESEDPSIRLRAAHVAAYALAQTDRSGAARRALVEVLEQLKDTDPFWGWSSLTTLAVLSYRAGWDPGEVAEWLEVYERAMDGSESAFPAIVPAARAWIRLQIDPTSRPADVLELVREAPVPDYPAEVTGTHEMLLGAAAWLLDEPAVALERLSRSLEIKRRADQPGEMTQTLIALALVQFAVGDYDAVEQAGRLVQDIAEARNQSYAVVDGYELQARVAGIRGDAERARELCDRVLLEIPAGEALALEVTVRVTMSWLRLAEHDVQGAWREVSWIFHEDGEPRHPHICYRELGTYASAALRAGAVEHLGRVLEVARRRLPDPRPYHRLQLARARALAAGEDAEPWHLEAVHDPDAARWPFELANAQLEYGAWLRRRHRPTDARAQLQPALETFSRLATRVWAELARAELRAAGVATAVAEPSAWAGLTGQERQVVRLAATGMTNPEIAAALYLSPRTVSTHLYHAFPKLGVTARAQLRDVVPEPT